MAIAPEPGPEPARRAPSGWLFVPSLYFAEGLPYTVVNLVSVPMLKGLGASNEAIGLTSLLYLPWALKGLWGPLVDRYGTRRRWILGSQAGLAALLGLLALALLGPSPSLVAVACFALLAVASATHDIAVDGYYLEALDPTRQTLFVGVRGAAYKVAWLAGQGGLVYVAGALAAAGLLGLEAAWAAAFGLAALVFAGLTGYHLVALPRLAAGAGAAPGQGLGKSFAAAFRTYLELPRVGWLVAFILLFRLGDAFMIKMAQPFLMDAPELGGLGLSTEQIGVLYGTVGTLFSLAGGLLGGWLIAHGGLRRWMLPLALTQAVFILLYLWLAWARPGVLGVALVNAVEQLAYGLGVSAYTVVLFRAVRPEHRAAHYAITTSLMAVGMMLPGALSGYLAAAFGYQGFFLACALLSLPGLLLLLQVPYREAPAPGA
jgi:MFS transporter, PAT family, beta-lactamase induction signal transducer AmpG